MKFRKQQELQGDSQVFTAEMVQKMRDGVDGWGNTNWYDKVYGTGTRTHHNISATGGSDRVRFFASIGYLNEDGNIDNYGYNRLNLRSNIDAKLTKSLTFTLGVSGRIEKRDSPRYSADPNAWHNVPQQIIRALPYVPDTYEYEGKTYNVSTPTASSPVARPAGARVRFQAPRLRNANFAAFSLQTAITKEEPMKNFLRLDGRSILSVPYMYIDHKDYLADSLLTQNHVSVRFGSEFSRDNSPYHIIICKVRKKDTAEFEKSMELLCNKMLLFGHNDYMEFCNNIMETLGQNRGAA